MKIEPRTKIDWKRLSFLFVRDGWYFHTGYSGSCDVNREIAFGIIDRRAVAAEDDESRRYWMPTIFSFFFAWDWLPSVHFDGSTRRGSVSWNRFSRITWKPDVKIGEKSVTNA